MVNRGFLELTTRDSWAKQRGVTKGEAKQSYVAALLKVNHTHACS